MKLSKQKAHLIWVIVSIVAILSMVGFTILPLWS